MQSPTIRGMHSIIIRTMAHSAGWRIINLIKQHKLVMDTQARCFYMKISLCDCNNTMPLVPKLNIIKKYSIERGKRKKGDTALSVII